MQAQRRRGGTLVIAEEEPDGGGDVTRGNRGRYYHQVPPVGRELRIDLNLLGQGIDARDTAMLAAWGGVIGCWNAFVTVVVTIVMMVLAASVCRCLGSVMDLTMRVMPATAENGVDEQHCGRQVGEKCLHGKKTYSTGQSFHSSNWGSTQLALKAAKSAYLYGFCRHFGRWQADFLSFVGTNECEK